MSTPILRARAVVAASLLAALLLTPHGASGAGPTVICRACGEVIEGGYITAGGETYHAEHFVCEICQKPLEENYILRDGKNYHPDCYDQHLALKCDLCGGRIDGRYIRDYWGHAYHESHKGKVPQCAHCSRFISGPLTGGGYEYEDGRSVCGICYKTAIRNESDARRLMEVAAERLASIGMRVNPGKVTLHLSGLPEIRGLAGSASDELRGYTDYSKESFLGFTVRTRIDVYILHGMPRESALATLAHELTHVWQAERERLDNDEAFSEGSCNYAAYLVVKKEKTPQGEFVLQAMRRSEDEIYGEGFRRVKRFAEENGIREWLRRLAEEGSLPAGY